MRGALSVLPDLEHLAQRKAGVQCTPHVPYSLFVPRAHVETDATHTLAITACCDVALADRTDNGSHGQVAVEGKETLDVHVQVLADRLGIAIPAPDPIDQLER